MDATTPNLTGVKALHVAMEELGIDADCRPPQRSHLQLTGTQVRRMNLMLFCSYMLQCKGVDKKAARQTTTASPKEWTKLDTQWARKRKSCVHPVKPSPSARSR